MTVADPPASWGLRHRRAEDLASDASRRVLIVPFFVVASLVLVYVTGR
jgi:hypothetical protein